MHSSPRVSVRVHYCCQFVLPGWLQNCMCVRTCTHTCHKLPHIATCAVSYCVASTSRVACQIASEAQRLAFDPTSTAAGEHPRLWTPGPLLAPEAYREVGGAHGRTCSRLEWGWYGCRSRDGFVLALPCRAPAGTYPPGCVFCARACNNNDAVQTTFTELSELLVVEVPSPVQGPPTAVYVRLYLACDPLPTEPPAAKVMAAVLAAFGEFDGCVRGRAGLTCHGCARAGAAAGGCVGRVCALARIHCI